MRPRPHSFCVNFCPLDQFSKDSFYSTSRFPPSCSGAKMTWRGKVWFFQNTAGSMQWPLGRPWKEHGALEEERGSHCSTYYDCHLKVWSKGQESFSLKVDTFSFVGHKVSIATTYSVFRDRSLTVPEGMGMTRFGSLEQVSHPWISIAFEEIAYRPHDVCLMTQGLTASFQPLSLQLHCAWRKGRSRC